MNDIIKILGERWTYVYSAMGYGNWGYNKDNNSFTSNNTVSFSPTEIDDKIAELESGLDPKDPSSAELQTAILYLRKIKDKIGH
jgi:hypothetical protein